MSDTQNDTGMDRSQNASEPNDDYRTRRGVLTAFGGVGAVALAGCSLDLGDEPPPTDGATAMDDVTATRTGISGPAPTPTASATATPTASPTTVPPRVAVLSPEARQALELSETNRGELEVPVAGGD